MAKLSLNVKSEFKVRLILASLEWGFRPPPQTVFSLVLRSRLRYRELKFGMTDPQFTPDAMIDFIDFMMILFLISRSGQFTDL